MPDTFTTREIERLAQLDARASALCVIAGRASFNPVDATRQLSAAPLPFTASPERAMVLARIISSPAERRRSIAMAAICRDEVARVRSTR